MENRVARLLALVFALLPACGSLPLAAQSAPQTQGTAATDAAQWRGDLAAWRAHREHELAAPDGPLTLVGLEWLKPGINSVGAAPDNQIRLRAQAPDHLGLLTVGGKPPGRSAHNSRDDHGSKSAEGSNIVQLLAPAAGFPPGLTIDGNPAREGPLAADSAQPPIIAWHSLTLAVLRRGDRYALRIKDADAPTRTGFHGLNWYQPDPRYRVTARWIPFKPPQVERIPTVIGASLEMTAPGVAEFLLNGKVLLLEPVLEGGDTGTLFFILSDETSKTTTYETARYLHTGLPDHGLAQPGVLTLDFNRLENPPCAYTPYATCPLPPAKNRLPVALEAGERRYAH